MDFYWCLNERVSVIESHLSDIMANRLISASIGQEKLRLLVEIRIRLGCLLGIEIGWSVIEGRLF